MINYHLPLRLKRLRRTPLIRTLVAETRLHPHQFIAPIFVDETITAKHEITSMPGQFRLPTSALAQEIEEISNLNIPAVLLFGIPNSKDGTGSASLKSTGIIQQAIQSIKQANPNIVIITDVCFCEYTNHGHCGALQDDLLDNDATLALLGEQAVSHAEAGADWVAPSSMTDGMVGAIRQALDNAGFHQTAILSYAVKYCSSFYAPFGEAAQGAPQFGDRKSYQMDPANSNEALREAALDLEEGADMLMVKPAMNYLDIIYKIKNHFPEVPLGAYQVSGEYSILKNAIQQGLLNEERTITESLLAIKRAGADLIISYFAKDMARFLKQSL